MYHFQVIIQDRERGRDEGERKEKRTKEVKEGKRIEWGRTGGRKEGKQEGKRARVFRREKGRKERMTCCVQTSYFVL